MVSDLNGASVYELEYSINELPYGHQMIMEDEDISG
jgi:hypothetical protein